MQAGIEVGRKGWIQAGTQIGRKRGEIQAGTQVGRNKGESRQVHR